MKVSVITVCLNAKELIEDTILSVLNQSFTDIEYIVIDAVSTDGTLDIINQYRDRIDCLISERDAGIYDAMNKAVQLASGQIVYFLNAGDLFSDNDVIKNVVDFFNSNQVDVVYGKIDFLQIPPNLSSSIRSDLWKYNTPFNSRRQFLGRRMSQQNFFTKKEVFKRVGLFNVQYFINADFDWFLRALNKRVSLVFMDREFCLLSFGGASYQCRYNVLFNKIYIVFKNSNIYDFSYFMWHGILSMIKDLKHMIFSRIKY